MKPTQRPASPTLFQVGFTNGDTWIGTEEELRTQHPKWIPYATVLPVEASQSHMHQPQSNRQRAKSYPPDQQAAPHRAGLHPDDSPYWTTDLDVGEPDEPPYPRSRSTIRRYDYAPLQGNTRYEFRAEILPDIPRRRSAPPTPTERQTTASPPVVKARSRFHLHWFLLVGVGAMVALSLWFAGTELDTWWQKTQWDWTYTSSFRTYSVDAVVGHNHDSPAHPSHFIVQNDKRHIVIVEFPADDPAKVITYYGPVLLGDGQDNVPITISFQADAQTGRVDMLVHVQGQSYLFTNTGTKFIPATSS